MQGDSQGTFSTYMFNVLILIIMNSADEEIFK